MIEPETDSDTIRVETGDMVFNEDGQPLGIVTKKTGAGFEVGSKDASDPGPGNDEEVPGQEFGEGYLMWRCNDCGKMGKLESGMPSRCPNCGAPEEVISAVEED